MYDIPGEFSKLKELFAAGAPVAEPVLDSFVKIEGLGFGYLLHRVGRVHVVTTAEHARKAFASLAQLHALGFVHFDARLENLLEIDGKLCWIDVVSLAKHFEESAERLRRSDVEQLARSMLRKRTGGELHSSVREAIEAYTPGNNGTVEALAEAVAGALLLK